MKSKQGKKQGNDKTFKRGSTYRKDDRSSRTKRNDRIEESQSKRDDQRLSPLNDFSWYNRNPLLTQAAASIPFPYRPGMDISLDYRGLSLPSGATLEGANIPGIMALDWQPSIGQASLPTDPAAIAAKEVYATIRDAFSGTLSVDAPDLMIYFLSLDSIFSYIGALKRIFRIVTTYSSENYTIPDVLLQALGLTDALITDCKVNRMQLFQVINELVGMTHKFKCPAVFDLFNRHYWMNDNVYTDAATANSQMYVFVEKYFYQFALQNTPDGVQAGGLAVIAAPWVNSNTVATLFSYGRNLIDQLAESEDAYTISGYLRRAYEGSADFRVDEITLDEKFAPVYVPEVLRQIENSHVVNGHGVITPNSAVVSQNPKTNALISNPKVNSVNLDTLLAPHITSRMDMPGVEEVVECTRLHAFVDSAGWIWAGTEIPLRWNVYMTNNVFDGGSASLDQVKVFDAAASTPPTIGSALAYVGYTGIVSQFDWHPLMYVLIRLAGTTKFWPIFQGDIHNITVMDPEVLKNINKICLYSEFNAFNL